MTFPGIYIEPSNSSHRWEDTCLITGDFIFDILVTEKDMDPNLCLTKLIHIVGDVFDELTNLTNADMGGNARMCRCTDIVYTGHISQSGTKREAVLTFIADKDFLVV